MAANKLGEEVLGKTINSSNAVPNKYTGEKIRIEYLYSQTGKVLQEVDEEDEKEEEEDEDTDEGFHETEVIDQTIFPVEPEPHRQNPEENPTLDPDEESVGPDGREGYGSVTALAEFLLQLETCSSLKNGQARLLIELWSKLSPYDKKAVTFSPRHKTRLTQGRFKQSKSSSIVPGVDSTKRCFLGQNSGPAQRPDCNRYMESLMIMLCQKYPANKKINGKTILRWTLIGKAYKKIRDVVLSNRLVMERTNIQLVEINQATLTRWHSDRCKQQERDVLEQGLPPVETVTTSEPLPAAVPLQPTLLPVPTIRTPHPFILPKNTQGQARSRTTPSQLPTPVPLQMQPLPSSMHPPTVPTSTSSRIPKSTQSYRKRKHAEALAGEAPRRYKERTAPTTCHKCGQERGAAGHRQYFGNWYCPSMGGTYEQWREQFGDKYKRKGK